MDETVAPEARAETGLRVEVGNVEQFRIYVRDCQVLAVADAPREPPLVAEV